MAATHWQVATQFDHGAEINMASHAISSCYLYIAPLSIALKITLQQQTTLPPSNPSLFLFFSSFN